MSALRSFLLGATLALACAAAPGASPNNDALLARSTANENDLLQRRSHGISSADTQMLEATLQGKNGFANVQGGWTGWTGCTKQCGGGTRSHSCTNPAPV